MGRRVFEFALLEGILNQRKPWLAVVETLQLRNAGPAFGPPAGAAFGVAGLFVILPAAHFLLDSRVFHQFAKPFDGVLNAFVLSQAQLNHSGSFF